MKKLLCVLLAMAMVLALIGCGKSQPTPAPAPEAETSEKAPEPAPEETVSEPEFDWTKVNPLTGEPSEVDVSGNRPFAVMLNNVRKALPQSGNAQADVLYEVPEEGGSTRIMGLYQNFKDVGTVGTIRSTRPYYVRLAFANEAILVHAGGSGAAYTTIKDFMTKGFDDIDFLEKDTNSAFEYFYRDQARFDDGYESEHTLYTTSEKMYDYITENPGRVETLHTPTFKRTHVFVEDATPVNGSDAVDINVKFSSVKDTEFHFDEESGTYLVSEFQQPYMDAASGTQVAVENVVIILTDVEELNDAKQHVAVTLVGTGSGWFACNGKMQKIIWSKESNSETFTFTDEAGNDVPLGIGKSFVSIVDRHQNITVDGVVMEKPLAPGELTTQSEEDEEEFEQWDDDEDEDDFEKWDDDEDE